MQRQNASQYDIIYSVAFVQKEQIFHIKYMDEECSVGGEEGESSDLSRERTRILLLVPFLNLQRRKEEIYYHL